MPKHTANAAIHCSDAEPSGHFTPPPCLTCGERLRYGTDTLIGYSTESCQCGTRRMQPYVAQPIDIPDWMKGDPAGAHAKVSKKCPWCARKYLTLRRQPMPQCGRDACYRKHRASVGRPVEWSSNRQVPRPVPRGAA